MEVLVVLPPQIATQSPRWGFSESNNDAKHSSCISAGISFLSSFLMILGKLGPGTCVMSEKSSPNETPKANAAATNATPTEAEAWIDVEEGIRAALKSVAMAYSWNAAFLISR